MFLFRDPSHSNVTIMRLRLFRISDPLEYPNQLWVDASSLTGFRVMFVCFRLSTIIGADQILVLHDGTIAERGR